MASNSWPPFGSNVVQLAANQPWNRKNNDVYGRKNRLTFAEAIGVTGGTQTTHLDASINGVGWRVSLVANAILLSPLPSQ
jgi:hypothetical protein